MADTTVSKVKLEFEASTDKAQSSVASLREGVKKLQDTLYQKTHQKDILANEFTNTRAEIGKTERAIIGMTSRLKEQVGVINEQKNSIAQMRSELTSSTEGLQSTLSQWRETGNAIGAINKEQKESASLIEAEKQKIPQLANKVEELKNAWKAVNATQTQLDKATSKRDKLRESLIAEMMPTQRNNPYFTENYLAGSYKYKDASAEVEMYDAKLAELKQHLLDLGNGKDYTTALEALNGEIANSRKSISALESHISSLEKEKGKLVGRARELSASFREVAGAEAEMKQSSIDAYVRNGEQAIEAETASMQANVDAYYKDLQAKIELENRVQALEAKLKQLEVAEKSSASATNEEATAQKNSTTETKKATSAHHGFNTAVKNISKALKTVKSHISSVVGHFKSFASSLKSANPMANIFKNSIGKLASTFKRLFIMRLLRNAIMQIINAFKEGTQNVARYSAALNNMDANHANQTMSELASTGQYLKNVLGSAVIPVLNALLPIIRSIATGFATAVNYVNQFMSALGGKTSWTRAKQVTVDYAASLDGTASSAGSAKDAVEDLKRTILGFDEINKLNDATGTSGSGGSGGGSGNSDSVNYADMFEEVPIDNRVLEWLDKLKKAVQPIVDAWGDMKKAIKELVESEGFKYLVGEIFRNILKGIETAIYGITRTVTAFKEALNDSTIKSKIGDISDAWDGVLKAVKALTDSDAWKSVVKAVTFVGLTTIEGLLSSISGIIGGIQKGIEKLDENGKLAEFQTAWENVTTAFSNLFNAEGFQELESTVLYMFVTGISGALDTISSIITGSVIPALNDLKKIGTFEDVSDAWDKIWKSIKSIAESDAFKTLTSATLKLTIEGIATALKIIADALGTIDSILHGDLEGTISGLANIVYDVVFGIAEAIATLMDQLPDSVKKAMGIDPTVGYAEFIRNEAQLRRDAIENGTTVEEERRRKAAEERAKQLVESGTTRTTTKNDNGYWDFGLNSDSFDEALAQFDEETKQKRILEFKLGVSSFFNDINTWKKDVWEQTDEVQRGLAFRAYIDSAGEDVAKLWESKVWDTMSEDDKELAFKAFVDSLPEDVAGTFAWTFDELSDEEKFLAFVALATGDQKDVVTKYLAQYWNPDEAKLDFSAEINTPASDVASDFATQFNAMSTNEKLLAFRAYLESTGKSVAEAFKDEQWAFLSKDDKQLLFNAFIGNKSTDVAGDFNKSWIKDVYPKYKLTFDATTGKDAPKNVKESFVSEFDKLSGRVVSFGATVNTEASTVASTYKTNTWNRYTGANKTLGFGANITTTANTLSTNMTTAWNKLNTVLGLGSQFNMGASGDASSKATLYGQLNNIKTFFGGKNIGLNAWFNGGSSGDADTKATINGQLNRIKNFYGSKNIGLNASFNGGASGDGTGEKTIWGQWNRLSSWFGSKAIGLNSWFNGGSSGDGTDKKTMNGQWNRLTTFFGDKTIGLYSWFSGGSSADGTGKKTLHGQWNRLVNFFDDSISLYPWFSGGSSGDGTSKSTLWGQWNRIKNFFDDDIPLSAKITSLSVSSDLSAYLAITGNSKNSGWAYTGGIIGKATGGIISRAVGGVNARLFDSAQLFTARENGIPEYVGRFGSRSAVANNYQIVTGIAEGVSNANAVQNELLREQNTLLAQLVNNGSTVNVSSILGAVNRVNKRTGQPVVTMG